MLVQTPKFIQALFPSLIWRKETKNKEIWLTFDDGPDLEVTPWILAVLKKETVKATFFLVGEQIEQYPKLEGRQMVQIFAPYSSEKIDFSETNTSDIEKI